MSQYVNPSQSINPHILLPLSGTYSCFKKNAPSHPIKSRLDQVELRSVLTISVWRGMIGGGEGEMMTCIAVVYAKFD